MIIPNSKKKAQKKKYPYSAGVLRRKYIIVSAIIFIIITLSNMAAPCFAADNDISWIKGELAFMDKHPVLAGSWM